MTNTIDLKWLIEHDNLMLVGTRKPTPPKKKSSKKEAAQVKRIDTPKKPQ